jgi:hypothetical protein
LVHHRMFHPGYGRLRIKQGGQDLAGYKSLTRAMTA